MCLESTPSSLSALLPLVRAAFSTPTASQFSHLPPKTSHPFILLPAGPGVTVQVWLPSAARTPKPQWARTALLSGPCSARRPHLPQRPPSSALQPLGRTHSSSQRARMAWGLEKGNDGNNGELTMGRVRQIPWSCEECSSLVQEHRRTRWPLAGADTSWDRPGGRAVGRAPVRGVGAVVGNERPHVEPAVFFTVGAECSPETDSGKGTRGNRDRAESMDTRDGHGERAGRAKSSREVWWWFRSRPAPGCGSGPSTGPEAVAESHAFGRAVISPGMRQGVEEVEGGGDKGAERTIVRAMHRGVQVHKGGHLGHCEMGSGDWKA